MSKKGKFIVIDGMDGVGKGVFLDTLILDAKKSGLKVFDLHDFWKHHDRLPTLNEVEGYDVIYSSEPTYFGLGKVIRHILINKDLEVKYSTQVIANAYALDRHILYEGLLLSVLKKGIHVFQSRCVSTSLVYQHLTGKDDGMSFDEILNLAGNKFALEHAPDYLIVPIVENPEDVIKRLENRDKKDNAIFENIDFQIKVKKEYESFWLKELFEKKGTKVIYMDAGKTIEYSKQQISEFYEKEFRVDK